jgi:hypothetical protein
MKIWANDLKVGDAIWYEDLWCFKHSKVVEIDCKTFKMPSLIMENNDRLFVNQYCYTDKSDITSEMIDNMLLEAKTKQFEWGEEITLLQTKIDTITKQINDLENFKNE